MIYNAHAKNFLSNGGRLVAYVRGRAEESDIFIVVCVKAEKANCEWMVQNKNYARVCVCVAVS
jgi:hypothetical protein